MITSAKFNKFGSYQIKMMSHGVSKESQTIPYYQGLQLDDGLKYILIQWQNTAARTYIYLYNI